MFENRFDEAIENISTVRGLNWSDDSKVRLFARFLEDEAPNLFETWETFLESQAMEEKGD